MTAPRVTVLSPFPIDSKRGNSVSARRIGALLEELGVEVRVEEVGAFDGSGADGLVALHARRCRGAVARFQAAVPDGKLVVVLTGSDLHTDLPTGGEAANEVIDTLGRADLLVVAQEGSVEAVPARFREKLVVVRKSVDVAVPAWAPPAAALPLKVVMAAHLRPLKDPFRAVEALKRDGMAGIEIEHFGEADDAEVRSRAAWEGVQCPAYRWRGGVAREVVVEAVARAHVHLNTALMEGGANSVCEAMVAGVPVVATRIPGNVGMLGEGYGGYFDAEDTDGLAGLLRRCRDDRGFLDALAEAVQTRAALFTREAEREGWRGVLTRVFGFPAAG